MQWTTFLRHGGCLGLFAVFTAAIGCEPVYSQHRTIDLRPRVLQINDHAGGTRHRTIVNGNHCYQSYGATIDVLSPTTGILVTSVEAAPFGEIGPISDMLIASGMLYVVHAGDRVIEYDLTTPRRPSPARVWLKDELGLSPLELSAIGPAVWVSGRSGTTSLDRPGDVKLSTYGRVGRVVKSSDGLVATAGRRVHRLDDGAYVGAATDLQPAPASFGIEGGLVFVLQASTGASVGVMAEDVRELDSKTVVGTVRRVRVFEDSLIVITDSELIVWTIGNDGLMMDPRFIKIKGTRDVAMASTNRLLVGGTFGRAIYRIERDEDGEGETFLAVKRTPGRLSKAITDGRRILAGSEEGNWMYRIGSEPKLSEKPLSATTSPFRNATLSWGEANIVDDGYSVLIDPVSGPPLRWAVPDNGRVYALETADDRLWIGHDEGIDVLAYRNGGVVGDGKIVLEGPVMWLFRPLVGDHVAWVSVYGGVGSAEMVPDPNADASLVRRVPTDELEKTETKMRRDAGLSEKK